MGTLSEFDKMMIDTGVSVFLEQVRDECKASHCDKVEDHVRDAGYDCAALILEGRDENPYKTILSKLRNMHRLQHEKNYNELAQ
jgi:hypothetical protein